MCERELSYVVVVGIHIGMAGGTAPRTKDVRRLQAKSTHVRAPKVT